MIVDKNQNNFPHSSRRELSDRYFNRLEKRKNLVQDTKAERDVSISHHRFYITMVFLRSVYMERHL